MQGISAFVRLLLIILLVTGGWFARASAEDMVCPKTIAAIENDSLSRSAVSIMERLYRELGCDPEFVYLPPRRGIHNFNTGLVDGELFRLRQAESLYKREFLRTEKPLFMLSNSLWLHPVLKGQERYLIGYIGGVVWQENYMESRRGKLIASSEEMFQAYNKGQIKGFLAADTSVINMIVNKKLSPRPEQAEVLVSEPLYHYVGQEFGPFIRAFSEKLKSKPFDKLIEAGGN